MTERQGHYSRAKCFQVCQFIHGISICFTWDTDWSAKHLSHTHACCILIWPCHIMHTHAEKFPSHAHKNCFASKFFFTLCSSLLFISDSLSLSTPSPSSSVCLSDYFSNQARHELLPHHSDLTLFAAFLHSLPSPSLLSLHLCYTAVNSALKSHIFSHSLSFLSPLSSLGFSYHSVHLLLSLLLLSDKAINSTLRVNFNPSLQTTLSLPCRKKMVKTLVFKLSVYPDNRLQYVHIHMH